ncbi:MAG: GNAT family N-acetyltransferase [Nocardioidaceae bacterium]|nr:GNAT family N-acetyltransferase [Nocardioidaceae bacterium]
MYEQRIDPDTPALDQRSVAEALGRSLPAVLGSGSVPRHRVPRRQTTSRCRSPSRPPGSRETRRRPHASTARDGLGEIGFSGCEHPDVRGRGVTTAAVRLLLDWAFTVQGLHMMLWPAIEGNDASLRVAWKTGFTFEGRTRTTFRSVGSR